MIRRIQESGLSQAQVANDLGISANTFSRWVKQNR
jgi:transposase-like protein